MRSFLLACVCLIHSGCLPLEGIGRSDRSAMLLGNPSDRDRSCQLPSERMMCRGLIEITVAGDLIGAAAATRDEFVRKRPAGASRAAVITTMDATNLQAPVPA